MSNELHFDFALEVKLGDVKEQYIAFSLDVLTGSDYELRGGTGSAADDVVLDVNKLDAEERKKLWSVLTSLQKYFRHLQTLQASAHP